MLLILFALLPVSAIVSGSEEPLVDTECIYPGMDKSISDGFEPIGTRTEARFIMPLLGEAGEALSKI